MGRSGNALAHRLFRLEEAKDALEAARLGEVRKSF